MCRARCAAPNAPTKSGFSDVRNLCSNSEGRVAVSARRISAMPDSDASPLKTMARRLLSACGTLHRSSCSFAKASK